MSIRSDTDDYFDLFVNDVPLMDVRAPVEFTKGAFPCAANIPLLDDFADYFYYSAVTYTTLGFGDFR